MAGLFKKNGIDVIEGHGVVTDDGNVKVGGNFDGTEIAAKVVILATGSVKKPLPGHAASAAASSAPRRPGR